MERPIPKELVEFFKTKWLERREVVVRVKEAESVLFDLRASCDKLNTTVNYLGAAIECFPGGPELIKTLLEEFRNDP